MEARRRATSRHPARRPTRTHTPRSVVPWWSRGADPGNARRQPALDLVLDRVERAGPVLGEDALGAAGAEKHDLDAPVHGLLPEVGGDVAHGYGADERHSPAADQNL